MRVRYKENHIRQFYESGCLTTMIREPSPVPTGPFGRCVDCPYPGHGFVCWRMDGETCLRTEMARIMERDQSVASAG